MVACPCCIGSSFIMSNSSNSLKSVLPKQQILDSSNLTEFADDNFRFDENGRDFSNSVENTVGKGGIACYKEFSKDLYCRHACL